MSNISYVLWARKPEAPFYAEEVITDTTSKAHLEAAKKWAITNGFINLRVQNLDLNEIPDFTKTLNI